MRPKKSNPVYLYDGAEPDIRELIEMKEAYLTYLTYPISYIQDAHRTGAKNTLEREHQKVSQLLFGEASCRKFIAETLDVAEMPPYRRHRLPALIKNCEVVSNSKEVIDLGQAFILSKWQRNNYDMLLGIEFAQCLALISYKERLEAEIKSLKQDADSSPSHKLIWNGSYDMLRKIFIRLSESKMDSSGRNIIDASIKQIEAFIESYFILGGQSVKDSPKGDVQFIYSGTTSALVRLFYYLSRSKVKSKNEMLIGNGDQYLYDFLGRAFTVVNKNAETADINSDSVKNLWGKTRRKYEQNLTILQKEEEDPHKKNDSLIRLIRDIVTQ
jgi:hypothetical protein